MSASISSSILIRTLFLSGTFILLISDRFVGTNGLTRTVKTTSWPNCDDFPKSCQLAKAKGMNVVYSKATHSSNDNLHYAFSTVGAPTVVFAHTTGKNRDFYFNYTTMVLALSMKDALSFTGDSSGWTVMYKFGVVFTQLIEYDDVNDTASVETCDKNHGNFTLTNFGNFPWFIDDVKNNSFVFKTAADDKGHSKSGNITFSFAVRGGDGRGSELPKLKYNSNMTQFDFEIDGVPPSYNHSRFAVEAVLSSLSPNKHMSMEQTRSIDDEYAPGVFLITDWLSNPGRKPISGYMQWKPVAYFAKDRARKVVTKVSHYELNDNPGVNMLKDTFVYAVFGDDLFNQSKVVHKASNISFGLTKDGFYLKNNYTVWSAAVGYGTPPSDGLSTTVIIIIAVGLGIPVIIMLLGGIYTFIKKCKQHSQDYQAIGDGEGVYRTNPHIN